MNRPVVTIAPYFKPYPGNLDAFKALLPAFIARTRTEENCLYYEFSLNGDVIFCREAYLGAEAALHHCQNVGELLQQATQLAQVLRLEIHGPAAEIEKLKQSPLADLKPDWYVTLDGIGR